MPGRSHRRSGVRHGFVSKAQWRLFYANPRLRKHARKIAHRNIRRGGRKTAYRALPYKTTSGRKSSRRGKRR